MSTPHAQPHSSWSVLSERLGELPRVVATACHARLPELASVRGLPVVATGGGLSEGPARVLVALLQRAGHRARFIAQSELVAEPEHAIAATGAEALLIAFSQGLAPNARLPLYARRRFARTLLVTSVRPGDEGVARLARTLVDDGALVWTLPPEREDRLLLRVVGPAVSLVAALRLAEALSPGEPSLSFDGLGAVVARALLAPSADLFGEARRPIVIVAAPRLCELAMPLRWKLLEGLRVADPPVWDPLQVAHGPLQAILEERTSVLMLRADGDGSDDLFARLRGVLARAGDRHRFVELRSRLPTPLAIVELDALLDAALLATLARHPLALDDWPCRAQDGPLYDLGAEEP